MKEFTAVSLFCGAGGFDLGFDRAGFRTLWANDFNADASATEATVLLPCLLAELRMRRIPYFFLLIVS